MKYYRLETVESQESYLKSSERELKENDVVVVIDYDCMPVTARALKEIDKYTALVSGEEIEPIFAYLDMTEINRLKEGKIRRNQIERIMKEKIEEVKMLETLEKYAGKNEEFGALLIAYKELGGGK